MVDLKNRPGMTDSVTESSHPLDNRANDSVGDKSPNTEDMDDEMNGSMENPEDLEEGEISDEIDAEAATEAEKPSVPEDISIEGEVGAALRTESKGSPVPVNKSRSDSKKERDGKHDRKSKRDERREERREKRRRDDDGGRDRLRKRRRDDKPDAKKTEVSENVEEEDEEMLFVRGASPSRPHSQSGPENQESNPSADEQNASPSQNRESRNREDRPRRRSRSRSRTRRDDRPGPRDRRDRDRERPRENGRERERDNRDRKRDTRPKPSEMCMDGRGFKGEDNHYSHNGIPMRKMELCKFYMQDCCAKKDKCLYMHKDFPCKYYHTGAKKCKAGEKQCKFSHAALTDVTKVILRRHLETAPKEILGDFTRSKRDEAIYNLEEPPVHQHKKPHIPSIFELNLRTPPGLENISFREEDEENQDDENNIDHSSFGFNHGHDDDDDDDGLQIDLGELPKHEDDNGASFHEQPKASNERPKVAATERPKAATTERPKAAAMDRARVEPPVDSDEAGGNTPIPENEYSSEDDGPKSLADVVKKVNDLTTAPSSLPNIPLPEQLPNKPDKLNLAAALQSLSAEQLTEMLELVKNKGVKPTPPQPSQTSPQQPFTALQQQLSADPRKRAQAAPEPSGATSPGVASNLPARDPRLARDPRQRADPRLKPTPPVSSTGASQPLRTGPFGTLNIPAKQEPSRTGDVDLRNAFVLPPLTLSDKDYRQSDVDMRSIIGKTPVNPFSSDVDLRQLPDPLNLLPFKPVPMHPPAREIDASLMSHPPLEWKVKAFVPPKPDYSHVKFNPSDPSARLDPRLQRYFRKEIEDSVELPGLSSPPPVYNPALEKSQVPVYDPRADLRGSESFSPSSQRQDPRFGRR